jgi:pyruvate/2-oxoglutarate dehydrogenase complex dihydrolipoamide dehydrogenase (E3) component
LIVSFDYDITVLGAGPAGLVAAKLANGLGKKTALVEKREGRIGGDCTWFGCVPSKTLIKSAYVVHQFGRLKEFGIQPRSGIQIDTSDVMAHVRATVEADAAAYSRQSFEAEGIDLHFGAARFIDENHVKAGDKEIASKKFVICTGSRPTIPPIEGLDTIDYLTNETVFWLQKLPRSMIVIGGGPIGVELAAALNRLGVHITLLQRSATILKKDDPELVQRLLQILRDEGVRVMLEATAASLQKANGRIVANVQSSEGNCIIEADTLLVAVGRTPNVDSLGLENAGVVYNKRGLVVDKHLRTTAKNIYAAGDIVPPYLFTHISEHEAVVATTNARIGLPVRSVNYDHIIWATFTDPELAHMGLTEQQARDQYGHNIRIYRWEHGKVDRARTDVATKGLTKVITDRKGTILGAHVLGHAAAEVLHEVQLAKSRGISFGKIASVIHAYPSYSDAVRQPAKKCHIDVLSDNFFVKLARRLKGK